MPCRWLDGDICRNEDCNSHWCIWDNCGHYEEAPNKTTFLGRCSQCGEYVQRENTDPRVEYCIDCHLHYKAGQMVKYRIICYKHGDPEQYPGGVRHPYQYCIICRCEISHDNLMGTKYCLDCQAGEEIAQKINLGNHTTNQFVAEGILDGYAQANIHRMIRQCTEIDEMDWKKYPLTKDVYACDPCDVRYTFVKLEVATGYELIL